MEGFAALQLMSGALRRLSPALLLFLGVTLPLILGGCFDYEARLRVHATGVVDAKIHTLLPPWLRGLPQAADAFYPTTATALVQKLGPRIKPNFTVKGGAVDGFEGRIASIAALDTRLARHTLVFSQGGAYTFQVTLLLPPDFADAVSLAVAQRAAELPRIPMTNRERVREAALSEFGYRLEAELPGRLVKTNGQANGPVVHWKVPLRQLMAGKPVELTASGQLTVLERIDRKIDFSSSF